MNGNGMNRDRWGLSGIGFLLVILIMSACAPSSTGPLQSASSGQDDLPLSSPDRLSAIVLSDGEELRVLATTSILADVVQQVAGEQFQVSVLIPVDTDPHTYEPVPADVQRMNQSQVIFINGLGLEESIYDLLKSIAGDVPILSLSEGIETVEWNAAQEETDHEDHENHEGADPHVWFDPANVMLWVENAQQALSRIDPGHAELYQNNAQSYLAQLESLDSWIEGQVSKIPARNRKLVTDHMVFNYFALGYGFETIGTVVPGYSSAAEPSPQELANLEDRIRELEVNAIFVGMAVNPRLAERIASDTDIQVVRLYTGSLSAADGPAGSYLELMRYDVNAIVKALSETR